MNLNQEELMVALGDEAAIFVFKCVSSTQDLARQYCQDHDLDQPVIFAADEQSRGYGKQGRKFYSPAATGIYLTLILPKSYPANPDLLTIKAAVACRKAIVEHFPNLPVGYKWVNDLYLHNKKVGGILCEQLDKAILIGIGLNISTQLFPSDIQKKAGALTGNTINNNQLMISLINKLLTICKCNSNSEVIADYRKYSILLAKVVTFDLNHGRVSGVVRDINDDGSLMLETEQGKICKLYSGEVIKVFW